MRFVMPLGALSILAWLAGSIAAQQPDTPRSTFRTGVELVQVDVSVLDHDRRAVRGLTAADFTLRVDGMRRPIAAFTAIDLPAPPAPATGAALPRIEPDVAVNAIPPAGRLVILLKGRGIRAQDMPIARRTATAAVEQLGPADLAAVMDGSGLLWQNFTADRTRLLDAVNRCFLGLEGESAEGTECRCGVCVLEAMTRVAEAVRQVPQRHKMLMFLGGSIPVTFVSPPHQMSEGALGAPSVGDADCDHRVAEARRNLLNAAGQANLTIHAVDVRGIEMAGRTSAEFRALPGNAESQAVDAISRHQRQQDLEVYPASTGGRAILNTNKPAELLPALFGESSSYYVLAFEPADPRGDRRDHSIEVKVKGRGLAVHARRSYSASSPAEHSARAGKNTANAGDSSDDTPSLDEAISGLLGRTGLEVSAAAAPFAIRPSKSQAAVFVTVRVRQTDVEPPPGGIEHTDVLVTALDEHGQRVATDHQQTDLSVTKAGRDMWYDAVARLELKPGRYEIRAAARHLRARLIGSVYTNVDVPDFQKAPLALSGIIVRGDGSNLMTPKQAFNATLPLVPTTRRQFDAADGMHIFARVYQNANRRGPVTVHMTVADGEGRTTIERTLELIPTAFDAVGAADCRFDLPLAEVPSGAYHLTIDAAAGDRAASRSLRFDVR